MIRWRFNSLLGQLRDLDARAAEYRAIYAETGIATSTLTAMAKGTKRVDIDVADRLLTFFSVKLDKQLTTQDLLEFVRLDEATGN